MTPAPPWAGAGAWVWYGRYSGDADGVVAQARAAGLRWVAVKSADGASAGDQTDPAVFQNQFVKICPKLHAAGLRCLAWVYVYGADPAGEARRAAWAIQNGADGLIFDAEYELVGRRAQAEAFFAALTPALPPGYPLAFAPDFRILVGNALAPWSPGQIDLVTEPWPWDVFAANCQAVMPQLYWTDFQVDPATTDALIGVWKAARAREGWSRLAVCPIFPSDGTPADLTTALRLAGRRSCPGVSFWRLDNLSAANAVAIAVVRYGSA